MKIVILFCFAFDLLSGCSPFQGSAGQGVTSSSSVSLPPDSTSGSSNPVSSATPAPVPSIKSVCGQSPAYAVAAGFKKLDLEMNPATVANEISNTNTAGKNWYLGQWYQGAQDPSKIKIDAGALKLLGGTSDIALSTVQRVNSGTTGRSWKYGYFEADLVPRNWTSFWMVSYDWARRVPFVASNPLTYFSELDFFEGDELLQNYVATTIHRNTGNSGGINDTLNQGVTWQGVGKKVMGVRHKIGALWLPDRIETYLDGVKVNSIPTYDSNQQPHFLILSSGLGGVTQGTPGTTNNSLNESWWYSVCVWQP